MRRLQTATGVCGLVSLLGGTAIAAEVKLDVKAKVDVKAEAKAEAKPEASADTTAEAKPEATPTKPRKDDSRGVYTGKIALTGFFYTESDGIGHKEIDDDPTIIGDHIATTSRLGYGELRAMADARRIASGRIDFRFDVRLRATGSFDFEQKFNHDTFDPTKDQSNSLGTSSRGYLGGPEYDLREAYLNIRFNPRIGLQLGRMFLREADNIKLDGVRLWKSFGQHWEGSAFIGGAPNPYSRSLLSDYVGPCGAGVAGERDGPANSACTTLGPKLGLGLGIGARYAYSSLWGTIGLSGSIYNGFGDGGPLVGDGFGGVQGPDTALDAPRIFVSWLNAWRPAERFDLFSDLVFDAYGSAGPQLTRLVLLGTLRILRDDRLTMRVGGSYMSSLAVNMFLNRLVYNRLAGTTLAAMGVSAVENNLTILRTGRAEGRVTLDARFIKRLGGFVEGRVRYRSLINGASDEAVYQNDPFNSANDTFAKNVPTLAGDASLGIRDNGSIRGLRGGLSYNLIFDYLAQNHVINFDIGTDLWQDRIGLTLSYAAAITKDKQSEVMDPCLVSSPYVACFGRRNGMTHEIGFLGSFNPWRTLFIILDYRFIAMLTNQDSLGIDVRPINSHAILVRTEFRW